MHKKMKKLLVWSLVVCMVLTNMLFSNLAFAATKTTALSSSRLAGADRYQTAVEISKAEWTTSQYAVLAYGEGFADALAAAPLAGKYDAPILLTQKDSIPAAVLDELKRLGVKNVFIVGGEGVVSAAVADALTAAGITVERLSGADRYATALAVANKLGTTSEVVVAYGEGFADALSISAIAAAKGMPILLTDKDAMSADVKAYIGSKKAYVVGGEGVVSAAVFNGLTGAVRLSGADRYATNLAVLQQFASEMNWLNVFVATGEGFADALAGSALAARYGSPVVLAANSIASATASFLAGKVNSQTGVIAFGGAAVVSDAVVGSVKPSVVPPAAVGVQSVTSLGLNGIRVVFSQEVDKDSAVNVLNYKIDGILLNDGVADPLKKDVAQLASDNKTLTIILNDPAQQYDKKLFTINDKAVLSKDTLTSIPKYEQVLTFSDTAVPTIEKVSVSGNKKLTVQFTEPVRMDTLASFGTYFKIDGNYLSSYGFNSTATSATKTLSNYGFKVDLIFDVAIPAGTHTLKTLKGSIGVFSDAASYFVQETDTNFTVDSVTTAPQVVSVTGDTGGTINVTFDRAMDSSYADNGAVNTTAKAMFGVNDDATGATVTNAYIKDNTDDKVIKVKALNTPLNEGANVLSICKDLKDAWGNKLNPDNDQRYSFTVLRDTVKPTVVSVVMIDNKHIRVKYSEDVDPTFATTVSNYTLKDSSGVTKVIDGGVAPTTTSADDTYTITLTYALTGSNYTLTIKNVIDQANPANTMDDYIATFNGINDTNAQVKAAVKVDGSDSKVAVYFDKSMDPASATDKANYAYLDTNASPSTRSLPSSATVTMGDTGKYVTIEFPSGYTVKTTDWYNTAKVAVGYQGSNYYIQQIRVSNVKDLGGNTIDGISVLKDVVAADASSEGRPKYNGNTFKLYKDSTSTRAEVEFDQVLTSFDYKDFFVAPMESGAINTAKAVVATSGYVSGKKVVLNYDDTVKAKVMAMGKDAYLYTKPQTGVTADDHVVSANQSGIKLLAFVATTANANADLNAKQVWDDQTKPEWAKFDSGDYIKVVGIGAGATLTDKDAWGNNVTVVNNTGADATTVVVLKFSEAIDGSISGLYTDDFVITQGGYKLDVSAVTVNGQYLIYTFNQAAGKNHASADVVTVKANATVDIRDLKDSGAGDYNTYAPSNDDRTGNNRGITVSSVIGN